MVDGLGPLASYGAEASRETVLLLSLPLPYPTLPGVFTISVM